MTSPGPGEYNVFQDACRSVPCRVVMKSSSARKPKVADIDDQETPTCRIEHLDPQTLRPRVPSAIISPPASRSHGSLTSKPRKPQHNQRRQRHRRRNTSTSDLPKADPTDFLKTNVYSPKIVSPSKPLRNRRGSDNEVNVAIASHENVMGLSNRRTRSVFTYHSATRETRQQRRRRRLMEENKSSRISGS